ncbi:MAG: ATP-binding protein [Faecalimonas umbilicata]|uniref:AAA family ATPase n=1 Tax=Faecalimonas umbilicata TaxID=1912855 RepID=UPI002A75B370|nr:ATP-binding protein [Faecalimonas umbilicata]MDY2762801.1 ATP-binding protein [Faecalimonas umbilicata]
MITKMYLTNFLSFLDRTEFDFTASKYTILGEKNVFDNSILKGALFIGPNASGKSNSLKGIAFLINMIKGEDEFFERYRCRFSKNPLVILEYEFVFSNKEVIYKVEYNAKTKNISEEITIDAIVVLKRDGTKGELRIGDSVILDEQLDNKTLFLRTASFNTGRFPQEPILRELMDYLNNSYYIDGYNRGASWGKTITKYAEEYGVESINKYLRDFNYDFFLEYGSESTGEGARISVGSDEKIVFFKRKSFPFPSIFYDESQGNQVFADMLPNLIKTIEKPGMFIFDEFGNSLHNKLAEKIVKYFMENSKKSQLFITSHATNLISNSVFRPDQIDLVIFNDSNGSKVTRLSKFKPREAQNLEKMYLGGMFEGIPLYEEI